MKHVNWKDLSAAFRVLTAATVEGGKTSDGIMTVIFENSFMYENPEAIPISVEFNAYAMPEMDRHHRIGPFGTEEEAYKAARSLLQKQVRFINYERTKNGMATINRPFVLLEDAAEATINEAYFEKHKE